MPQFIKSNYDKKEEKVDKQKFLKDALGQAMRSGGSIVVFLPEDGEFIID